MTIWVLNLLVISSLSGVFGQSNSNTTTDYPELREEWEYCLEFTWFGPDYDNTTNRYNGTCSDYLEETRADGSIPCAPPIVISDDGTKPNMDYLWDNHKTSILCRRSDNQRCVKYTYFFNNKVNNVTYMCAKVHYSNGEVLRNDNCYEEDLKGGYKKEICVCNSGKGTRYRPCNAAAMSAVSFTLVLCCALYQIFVSLSKDYINS